MNVLAYNSSCITSYDNDPSSDYLDYLENIHTRYEIALQKTKYCGLGYYKAVCVDCGTELIHTIYCKRLYCEDCRSKYLGKKRHMLYKLMEKYRGRGQITYSVWSVPEKVREMCRDKNRWRLIRRAFVYRVKKYLGSHCIIIPHTFNDEGDWVPHFNVITFFRRFSKDNWAKIRESLKKYWARACGVHVEEVNFYEDTTINWREKDKGFEEKAGHICVYVLRLPEFTDETFQHYDALEGLRFVQYAGWDHQEWGHLIHFLHKSLRCKECGGKLEKVELFIPGEWWWDWERRWKKLDTPDLVIRQKYPKTCMDYILDGGIWPEEYCKNCSFPDTCNFSLLKINNLSTKGGEPLNN